MKHLLITSLIFISPLTTLAKENLDIVKRRMVQESINSYSGNCPCPYNKARNGSRCGKRSAYSRPSGTSPLCFPKDISDAQARKYLKRKSK